MAIAIPRGCSVQAVQPMLKIPKLRIPEAVVNQISEGAVWILAASATKKTARRAFLTTN